MTNPSLPLPHTDATDSAEVNLRVHALQLLMVAEPVIKAQQLRSQAVNASVLDTHQILAEPPNFPARPIRPVLVAPAQLKPRAVGTPEGHAALLHALTHIEANAINLALDAVWRFADLPKAYYDDWWRVAKEEAFHFELLNTHLNQLGFSYGDFPAHDGLWEMARRTQSDLLARMALVPRTLEARGLDATPAVRNRLVSIGDMHGAEILDIILRDEIGHVAVGNHWFHWLCTQSQIDPVASYRTLLKTYQVPVMKGPFNLPARRKAGFDEAELHALQVS